MNFHPIVKPQLFGSKSVNSISRVSREGLIIDMPMLSVGDINDYSNNIGVDGMTNTAPWEYSRVGSILACTKINSLNLKVPIPVDQLPDYPCTIMAAGIVTSLSADNLYVSISWDGSADQSCGFRINNGKAQAWMYTGSFTTITQSTVTMAVGDHVVMIFVLASATSRTLYLDGEVAVSTVGSDAFPAGAGTFHLGAGANWRSAPFTDDATVTMLRLYNRALTADEVRILSNDPWADYRNDNMIEFAGSAIGGSPTFNPVWANNTNLIL